MSQTAITYPSVTVNEFTGETIKTILEDVADNLFNPDPYYQQGGDMVRVGGLSTRIDPAARTMGAPGFSGMTSTAGRSKPASPYKGCRGGRQVSEEAKAVGGEPGVGDLMARHLKVEKRIGKLAVNLAERSRGPPGESWAWRRQGTGGNRPATPPCFVPRSSSLL
jgi:sulfur-oxidizing protein SoxB